MPLGFGPIGSRPIGGKTGVTGSWPTGVANTHKLAAFGEMAFGQLPQVAYTYTRTLAYLSTTASAITSSKSLGKILTCASTTVSGVKRASARTLSGLSTSVGGLLNNFGHSRVLTATSVTISRLAKSQTLFRTLIGVSTTVGKLKENFAWVLTLIARPSANGVVKAHLTMFRTFAYAATTVGAVTRRASMRRTLSYVSTTVGAVASAIRIGRVLKAVSTTSGHVFKSTHKKLAYLSQSLGVFINSRYRFCTFTYTMTTVPKLKKHVFPKAKLYAMTTLPHVKKRVGKVLKVISTQTAMFPGYTRQYQRKLAYTSHTLNTVIRGVFKGPLTYLSSTLSFFDFAMGGFHYLTLRYVAVTNNSLKKQIAVTLSYPMTTLGNVATTVVHAIRRLIQLYL